MNDSRSINTNSHKNNSYHNNKDYINQRSGNKVIVYKCVVFVYIEEKKRNQTKEAQGNLLLEIQKELAKEKEKQKKQSSNKNNNKNENDIDVDTDNCNECQSQAKWNEVINYYLDLFVCDCLLVCTCT